MPVLDEKASAAAFAEMMEAAKGGELPNIPGIKRNPMRKKMIKPSLSSSGYSSGNGGTSSNQSTEPSELLIKYSKFDAFANPETIKDTNEYKNLGGRYSLTNQRKDRNTKAVNLPFGEKHLPRFIEYDRMVLAFNGWFKEPVPESPLESERVRIVEVQYYLEDDTMRVIEHRQGNSGMPQGDMLKRTKVPAADGSHFLTLRDLIVGSTVNIYGKDIMIVDANSSTRKYMAEVEGINLAPAKTYPTDDYTVYLKDKMSRETGLDTTVPRNRMMHPMKEYMESLLGRTVAMQDLGAFLEHDKKVLRFNVMWDDTDSLYGDKLHFKLHYYLVNDTIEIIPEWERNSGRDKIGKLLSRAKIVKIPEADGKAEEYYHWKDLKIDSFVMVFKRRMRILGADPFTRAFYKNEGIELAPDIVLPEPPIPVYSRPIPPPTGYGSEEDTLKNLWTFDPKPPLKDGAKAILNNGKVLRYGAKILSKYKDDEMRFFVIQYFMEDDTIAIQEPPIRNSGFNGGNFLQRTKIMKNTEDKYQPYDLFIGATVQLLAHRFTIIEADDYTLNFMESRAHEGWPSSNIFKIIEKLKPAKEGILNSVVKTSKGGLMSYDQVHNCLIENNITLDEQEYVTLYRALDPVGKKEIPSIRLVKKLE